MVERCLAKAPADRYRSARDVLAALDALPHAPAAAPALRSEVGVSLGAARRRGPRVRWPWVVLLAVACATAVGVAWRVRTSAPAAPTATPPASAQGIAATTRLGEDAGQVPVRLKRSLGGSEGSPLESRP